MDAVYAHRSFEFLSEYFRLENSDASSSAYYAQLSYEVVQDLRPYIRFESLDKDGDDPYLGSLSGGFDRRQFIVGMKYDIDEIRSGIKTQVRYDDTKNGKDYRVFETQWTFGF